MPHAVHFEEFVQLVQSGIVVVQSIHFLFVLIELLAYVPVSVTQLLKHNVPSLFKYGNVEVELQS